MEEIFLKKEKLITEEEWVKLIDELRKEADRKGKIDNSKAIKEIKDGLIKAVMKRADEMVNAILFSGGIDSTIIAKILKDNNRKIKCYTVGLKDSPDIEYSKKISEDYNFPIIIREISKEEIERAIPKVQSIIKTENKVETSIATVEYFGLEIIKSEGFSATYSGLGSEEIFAGYNRHLEANKENKDLNEECWKGLKSMYERDLIREYNLSKYFGIKPKTPFLDRDLIIKAMRVNGDMKIVNSTKKFVLRKASEQLGIREEYAMRPKKAAQYGSKINKVVMKYLRKANSQD